MYDIISLIESFKKQHITYQVPLKKDSNNLKIHYSDNKIEVPPAAAYPFATTDVITSEVLSAKIFYNEPTDKKSVYEITLSLDETKHKYIPGDTIGILVQNNEEDVDFLLERLDLKDKEDMCYHIEDCKEIKSKSIPNKGTLKYLLSNCLEIRSVLKKLFLLALAAHTTAPSEKEFLEILCCKEGTDLYNQYVLYKSTSIIDLLKNLPSCKPPITLLIQHLPRLLPRPYSIVNSQKSNSGKIKLCFSVMNQNKGLTTGWLEKIALNTVKKEDLSERLQKLNISNEGCVEFYFRKNMGFCIQLNSEKPVIMVGLGTGVAPFIGFLEELSDLEKELDTWMICGFKSPRHQLYKNELDEFLKNKTLTKLTCCYSGSELHPKTYVQDAILENANKIIGQFTKGAIMYLCGDLNTLAKEIEKTIGVCYENVCNANKEESLEFVKNLKVHKQLIVDAWS